jgi:glucose-1-phosphate adenylyltransferase
VVLGNDFFETADDLAANAANGLPPMGIGAGTVIEGAIVDKNVRVGRGVRIVNDHGCDSTADDARFMIRDGLAVVPKDAVLPDGWKP